MEVRLGCVLRDVQQCGHFRHACAQPIVQAQSGLVDFGESLNAFNESLIALRRFYPRVRAGLDGHRVRKRRFIEVRLSVTGPRLYVHGLVEGDAVDPGAEFRFAPKRRERVMNLQEYFLHDILSFRGKPLAEDGESETKYGVAMAAKQVSKGVLVAGLGLGYELGVVNHVC